ncbi:MAG: hypothetical protein ACRBBW_17180 [Cellvibrionaceae bacterium]
MKLHKRLQVKGEPVDIVNELVVLNLFSPGTATIVVKSQEALSGTVAFYCGYQSKSLKPWFTGVIESSTEVDKDHQRIFCRELSSLLFLSLPLALRSVNLGQVLSKVSEKTRLEFSIPESATYTTTKAPAFYSVANGYFALDSLAAVFGIDRLLWQQQVDGRIFVGSWNDSKWSGKPVDIPRAWEVQKGAANTATLPAVPELRPGARYNQNILTSVQFTGTEMKLTWDRDPWANR